ncbi:sodium:calcium antiporter [Thiomicrorhabdus sp. zzn3]|uniref:sodium:calcium antiporter n=1 Tax=Thiomicrorhabdus sp. zzn3 TaxID=3039775 RepID=UPI002436D3E2|nr:sodium:calcium antiporter [Thiomicrorhabdus sp. zzn3]MDG6779086.1 sodium:calcium antiporter [Thiomicrorhabdus sp. zzn3]
MNPLEWSLPVLSLLFACVAAVIAWFGIKMTHTARDLAHETGIGEALMGALFIGASTSLSGITTSVSAAASGYPELAVSNGLGGIAAQTTFLAIADIAYRRANLEHAAASAENLFMSAFLITLLGIHVLAMAIPEFTWFTIHPATLMLFGVYIFGIQLLAKTHEMPMWLPRKTRDTPKEPAEHKNKGKKHLLRLWLRFIGYSAIVAGSGWALAELAVPLIDKSGLSHGIVGGVFTAVSTSIPELVVAVTAVRMGALNLAVGDIIGGNAFDTLFISVSDIAYTSGSIYSAISSTEVFWLSISLVMTGILLMGLIYRQRHGPGNIGLESVALLLIYVVSVTFLTVDSLTA